MNPNIDKIINDVVSTYVSKTSLDNVTLCLARRLIRKVEEKATELGVKAVVAVADRGGRTIAVECMDDSYIASYSITI